MGKKPSGEGRDEISERYLGEIAPLLAAARRLDSLAPERKRQVRRRIMRTAFGMRRLSFRGRLAPVLIALAALVVGGAAFATAERLGLIPSIGNKPAPEASSPSRPRVDKRRAPTERALREVILPEIPDPLLLPVSSGSTVGWLVLADGPGPNASTAPAVAAAAKTRTLSDARAVGSRSGSSPRRLAYAVPAPVMPAPPVCPVPAHVAAVAPSVAQEPQTVAAVYVPMGSPVAAAAALPAVVLPALPPSHPIAVALPKENLHSIASDSVLFGQAMRKLRAERDPAAALTALQEHARSYPRSGLSAERNALEVEALLALHRDRDALTRLDSMALDELPRSGERLVVRGELRAAARRWLEASADFDQALARVSGSPVWHERALWGRAVARLRCGEREAGLADVEHYRDSYPDGRFAAEAARLLLAR